MACGRRTYPPHPLTLHTRPVRDDERLATEGVLDPWVDDRTDFVILHQRIKPTHAALRKADRGRGPLDPTGFVGEHFNFLVGGEQITGGLEVGEKGSLICLFVLLVPVGPDLLKVLRVGGVGVGDVTNPAERLRSLVSHQQLWMAHAPLTGTVFRVNRSLVYPV